MLGLGGGTHTGRGGGHSDVGSRGAHTLVGGGTHTGRGGAQ